MVQPPTSADEARPEPGRRDRASRFGGVDALVGATALLLAVLLAVWILPTYVRSPIAPRPLAMAPWFLPTATAGLIGVAGAALLARAWLRGGATAPGGGAAGRDPRGLAIAVGVLVLYPVLMPRLGALATGAALTLTLLAIARVGWLRLLVVGLLVPLVAWALFAEAIGIPLPRGRWLGI